MPPLRQTLSSDNLDDAVVSNYQRIADGFMGNSNTFETKKNEMMDKLLNQKSLKRIKHFSIFIFALLFIRVFFFLYQEYTYYDFTRRGSGMCESQRDTLMAKDIGSFLHEYKCINDLDIDIEYAYLEHTYYPAKSYFKRYQIHYDRHVLEVIPSEEFPEWYHSDELGRHVAHGVFSKFYNFENGTPSDTLIFNIYRDSITQELDTVRFVKVK